MFVKVKLVAWVTAPICVAYLLGVIIKLLAFNYILNSLIFFIFFFHYFFLIIIHGLCIAYL